MYNACSSVRQEISHGTMGPAHPCSRTTGAPAGVDPATAHCPDSSPGFLHHSVTSVCQLGSSMLLQVMSPQSMMVSSLTCQVPGLWRLEHVDWLGLSPSIVVSEQSDCFQGTDVEPQGDSLLHWTHECYNTGEEGASMMSRTPSAKEEKKPSQTVSSLLRNSFTLSPYLDYAKLTVTKSKPVDYMASK